jgi:hypothetical protein
MDVISASASNASQWQNNFTDFDASELKIDALPVESFAQSPSNNGFSQSSNNNNGQTAQQTEVSNIQDFDFSNTAFSSLGNIDFQVDTSQFNTDQSTNTSNAQMFGEIPEFSAQSSDNVGSSGDQQQPAQTQNKNLTIEQPEFSIDQSTKLPAFDHAQYTQPQAGNSAEIGVKYAQNINVEGGTVFIPEWMSNAIGIENNNPAVGAQPEISKTDKTVLGGEKLEIKLGYSGDIVRANGVEVKASANKEEGSVNAYNANENLFTRFTNAAGDLVGNYAGVSMGAKVGVDLTWDLGVKGTYSPGKDELKAVIGPQLELNANLSSEQRLDVKNVPLTQDTSLQAKQSVFAEGKGALGGIAKITEDSMGLRYWELGAEAGAQSTQSVTPLQVNDSGEPFANLNAAGELATGDTARKIQGLFEIGSVDQPSMVTVEVSNNNKVYEGPNNQDRATVYEWGGQGKYDQDSNVADKVLAGNYVRLDDQTRWLNEIGKQNGGNQNEIFSQVTAQDLESLNPGKIKEIDIGGEQVKVISAENVNTGIVREPDGSLHRAQSVDLGNGTVVNLP